MSGRCSVRLTQSPVDVRIPGKIHMGPLSSLLPFLTPKTIVMKSSFRAIGVGAMPYALTENGMSNALGGWYEWNDYVRQCLLVY